MPLTQSNFNPNQQSNGQAPQEKTNFKIGKSLRGTDGTVQFSLWKSKNNALYTSIQLRQMIGKDPNGRVNYEGGLAKDIPSVLLHADRASSLYSIFKNTPPDQINHVDKQEEYNTEFYVKGSPAGVTLTITNKLGTRTVTLPSIATGNVNSFGVWENFLRLMSVCINKCIMNDASEEVPGEDGSTPF